MKYVDNTISSFVSTQNSTHSSRKSSVTMPQVVKFILVICFSFLRSWKKNQKKKAQKFTLVKLVGV